MFCWYRRPITSGSTWPAQPERRGALPGPLPWRFPGRGVVGHGPGAAAAALAGGEVGDVVACVQGDVSRHDPCPPVPVPRSSFVMPVSDWFSPRTDGTSGECTICGFDQRTTAGTKLHAREEKTVLGHDLPQTTEHPDMHELRALYSPTCWLRSRDQASGSGLTLYPSRKARLRLPAPLPAEDAHPPSSAIRPARRPPLPCCPMLSGVPAYDCASVIKDRFPG